MSMLADIYRLLKPLRHPAVDAALAEALPTAERAGRRLIVLSLLERRNDRGMVSLIRAYHLLGKQLQQLVLENMTLLDTALRTAGRDDDPAVRLNVIDLIVQSSSYRLSYLLSAQLHTDDARVTRAAAAGLCRLAESAGRTPARRAGDDVAQRIRWLGTALSEACACYHQHGRHDIVLAAAHLAPRRIERLDEYLCERRCGAHQALREMLRFPDRPEITHAVLSFAALEPLRPFVLELLHRQDVHDHLGTLMETAHLTAAPAISQLVARVTEPSHLIPSRTMLASLEAPRQRMAVRWVRTLHMPAAQRIAALEPMLECGDLTARLLAVRALMELRDPQADEQMAPLCSDPHPVVARIALRHLINRRWTGLSKLLMRLVASPHEELRRMAELQLGPMGFERLWEQWDQMDDAGRTGAGRALMKLDAAFHRQLATRMADADSDCRFKAVMIARHLGQESHFDKTLIKLLRDPSDRVASAAAKALGASGDAAVAPHLRAALSHADDRVRANAIEALEADGGAEQVLAARQELMKVAAGRGNRSRANAIKALMQLPAVEAMPMLGRMLIDTDPRHRISALWVVERMTSVNLARQVAILAKLDDDPVVRRRALRVLRQLAQIMQEVG